MAGKRSIHTRQGNCERCGRHYFEVRQSGGKAARWCPECRLIVRREQATARVRRYREQKKMAADIEGMKARIAEYDKQFNRLLSPFAWLYGL